MKELKELRFFSELLSTGNNILVQEASAQGRIPIGYNCSLVPTPLLSLGNAFPVWLRAPEITDTETANFYLSPFSCSYSRFFLQNAIEGNYDYLGGLVFAESCVHIDRALHNVEESGCYTELREKPIYMLPVPRKDMDAYQKNLLADLHAIGRLMEEQFGADASDEAVREKIRERNAFNRLLKEIADMRLEDDPRITGTELHTVFVACQVAPIDLLTAHVKALLKELKTRKPDQTNLPRIMVMGSDMDDPRFTALIEKQGCRVVADRYCFGTLPGLEPIPEEGDPYQNLADYYTQISQCPRMMTKSRERLSYMVEKAREYRVDGIIFELMKFCDLWGWEVLKDEKAAAEAGIPTLKLDREYAFTGEGQMRTRVQAFIERIQNINLDAAIAGKEDS